MEKSDGTVRIWYDDWQMQCCGEPFGVGDSITLSVDPERDFSWLVPAFGSELVHSIDFYETHHEEPGSLPSISGTVTAIFIARPRDENPAPLRRKTPGGTGALEPVERIKQFERDVGNYSGYVIDLRPVRAAT